MAGLLENIGGVTEGNPTQISEEAQDVAKAQGVSFEGIAQDSEDKASTGTDFKDYDATKVSGVLDQNVDFKDASTYIDKASMTVAGQLEKLLGSDSPYIQASRNATKEQAAARGLQNSTLAAYAGQRAAIESALPIAQQDAQMYSTFGQAKQSADYNLETIQSEAIISGEMVEQKAAIDRKNTDINNAFAARLQGATGQQEAWLADLQNSYNVGLENLQSLNQQLLMSTEMDYNVKMGVAEASASIMQNYQVTVENWMSDPDFLALGKNAVNNAIEQLQNLAANSINFIGASQGIDMTPYIDEFLKTLTVYQ